MKFMNIACKVCYIIIKNAKIKTYRRVKTTFHKIDKICYWSPMIIGKEYNNGGRCKENMGEIEF